MSRVHTPEPEDGPATGEYNTPTRGALVMMSKILEKNKHRYPWNQISKNDLYKALDVAPGTAKYWIQHDDPNNPRRTGKDRPGRPTRLTEEILDAVEHYLARKGFPETRKEWNDLVKELELPCSTTTIRRHLMKRGFGKNEAAKKKSTL